MTLPILPTAIVGSYAMPGWLERLKTEYFARRISRHDLDEIHDAAVKAAIKDEEIAGLDIITDGELRRDNMVDYFVERMPGVQIDRSSKKFYYDFYDSVVQGKLPTASHGTGSGFPLPADWQRSGIRRFVSPVRIASPSGFGISSIQPKRLWRRISRK